MSSTTYYASMSSRTARTNLTRNIEAAVTQAQTIGRAVREIASVATDAQGGMFRQAMDSLGLRGLPMPSLAKASSCGLPSCDCPSPDLGEIRKVVDRPGPVSLAFRVRNTTKTRRVFNLTAKPAVSEDGTPGGSVSLSPTSVDLDPGETATIQVTMNAAGHQVGMGYNSLVSVAAENCETMHLGVSVLVETKPDIVPLIDLHCCCHPKVRPLRWYHHYYCDPPRQRDGVQTAVVATHAHGFAAREGSGEDPQEAGREAPPVADSNHDEGEADGQPNDPDRG